MGDRKELIPPYQKLAWDLLWIFENVYEPEAEYFQMA
jgi:hypothetical protein